ncbi:MAG TPA: BTAD domain-containing putative transcriptional regulator [Pseudonocardiaceae bacterium]|nr:BTAD domain-containing putative transcriptional regulator [Pseudonocardiaceae bacterium]
MEFLVLGPLSVRSRGVEIRLGGLRQRRLLVLLLINNCQSVAMERLVDELWDDPPQSARQQVHNAIGNLRRALPDPDALQTADTGYQLAVSDDHVDERQFQAGLRAARQAEGAGRFDEALRLLRSALDVWRGDAFAGIHSPSIDSAAARLNEQRLTAHEDLMSLRLRAGEATAVVGDLQELVATHPLREALRGSLMLALYQSGRQAESLAVYEQGRRLLNTELGLDPGPRLRALHADILSGAVAAGPPLANSPVPGQAEPPAMPPPPVGSSPRCFLPHDTRDFSGRPAEISLLLADARRAAPTAPVISAIDGMGGVGKTTLAIHIAHQVAKDYPDGQYFIDLHGFSRGTDPVTPEQALDTLLRASGLPPTLIPAGLDDRSALWRSRMAGQRVLLVLDNATDTDQVQPLLPGTPGVLVIMTSRRKLTALDSTAPVSLDVLPADTAIALFTRIAGADRVADEPAGVEQVVELCGRLPLAIRIAAARLRHRGTWSVADLVDRLRTHLRRTRFLQTNDCDVMAVLRLSYRYLSKQQQRLFRLLSLQPGPTFDAYAAAALAGLPLADAEQCLDVLFEDNLLRQDTAGRFYLHDLVADCTAELLAEHSDDTEAARRSLFDYYLHAAYSWSCELADDVYQMTPQDCPAPTYLRTVDSHQAAVNAITAEYRNLAAVARYAAANGWHRHAWQLPCILQPFLKLTNYSETSFVLFRDGLRAAREIGDRRGQSACLHGLASVCQERRSHDEAEGYLREAITLSREIGDEAREAAQLVSLGNTYFNDDRLAAAEEAFLAAQGMAVSVSDQNLRIKIPNNLGAVYRDLGQLDKAMHYFQRALAANSADDLPDFRWPLVWNIATVRHLQRRHDEAIAGFEEALAGSIDANSRYGEALALAGLCAARRSTGELTASLDLGERALHVSREFGLRITECEALCSLGEAMVSAGDLDGAEKMCQQAEESAQRYDYQRYVARAMEGFAHILLSRGQLEDTRVLLEQAARLYPDGMAEVRYAKEHLAALADLGTRCFRCEIDSTGSRRIVNE